MSPLLVAAVILMETPSVRFERHEIDAFPAGYQVAVADINGDGRPDVIALSTDKNRVDWYENPTWKRHPVARVEKPIDLAVYDIDGDGKPEIALASGFYFNESGRGGQIQWLKPRSGKGGQPNFDEPWEIHPIAVDPVVHRLRWAELEGPGMKKMLIHAPIFGPGSKANIDPKPSHLWAFRVPKDPVHDNWPVVKIDETLTVLHGLRVFRLPYPLPRDALLTASYEGVSMFIRDYASPTLKYRREPLFPGEQPADRKPGAARGCSEVAPGRLGPEKEFLATIEPWHGNKVVVYASGSGKSRELNRTVLDDTLSEGHALVVADFDGDGQDEIVAGWRGAGGGLTLYKWDVLAGSFKKFPIDRGIAVEGAVAADINGDGRLDLVVISGRTNKLVWYENKGK